jgi:hypothetical protein
MADNQIEVEIVLAVKEALDGIKKVQKSTEDFAKEASKSFSFANLSFSSMVGNFAANAATKGLELLRSGISAMVDVMGDAVHAAQEQEDATNRLNAALASNGTYSKRASQDLLDYAAQIQNTTKVSDDAALGAMALANSLLNLDVNGVKRATQAAIELSAVFKVDVESAIQAIANGSNGSARALKQFGIQFKDTGDQAKNFELIMAQVEQRFGGSAAASLNTFSGALAFSKNQFGELQESIGNIIVMNPAIIGAIKGLAGEFIGMSEKVNRNRVIFTDFINTAISGMLTGIEFLIRGLGYLATKWVESVVVLDKVKATYDWIRSQIFELIGAFASFGSTIEKLTGNIFGQQAAYDSLKVKMEESAKAARDESTAHLAEGAKKIYAVQSFTNEITGMVDNIRTATEASIAEYQKDSDAYVAANNTKLEAQNQFFSDRQLLDDARMEREFEQAEIDATNEQLKNDQAYQYLVDNLGKEEAARAMHQARKLEDEKKHEDAVKVMRDANQKAHANSLKSQRTWENDSNQQRVGMAKETLGQIAGLTASNNKTLFAIGKASSLALAGINVSEAVTKTLAYYPAPLNFALAAAVGLAGAVQLANIASQQPPSYATGGLVGGGSFVGDMQKANLNTGEMVLTRAQQTRLFNDISNGGGGGDVVGAINALGDRIANMNIVVQANSREIARLVRDERAAGFAV